jgi:hypothetical protein
VDQFLHDKFTNEELYLWTQGEVSRPFLEYYPFAFDTARKAERTMKQELESRARFANVHRLQLLG